MVGGPAILSAAARGAEGFQGDLAHGTLSRPRGATDGYDAALQRRLLGPVGQPAARRGPAAHPPGGSLPLGPAHFPPFRPPLLRRPRAVPPPLRRLRRVVRPPRAGALRPGDQPRPQE